jgi:alanine racemase
MGTGTLQIDLEALAANWRALDDDGCETAAVVKADGYGLGAGPCRTRLAQAGVRRFFVAVAEEGATLRKALGEGPEINVFSGHMQGDADVIARRAPDAHAQQRRATRPPPRHAPRCALRHPARQRHEPAGDGARRLGRPARAEAEAGPITLVMSHLACADEPDHPANAAQLKAFNEMTEARAPPAPSRPPAASCWAPTTISTSPAPASVSMADCRSPRPHRSCACPCR